MADRDQRWVSVIQNIIFINLYVYELIINESHTDPEREREIMTQNSSAE